MWVGWTMPWGWVVDADSSALAWTHGIGMEHHAWVTFWNGVCTLFSPLMFRVVTLGLIVYAAVRRQRRVVVFLVLSVELSGPLTELAKWAADRPRPATAMVYASSTSFPSGHALGVMVAVLALSVVFVPHLGSRWRPWLIAAGALIVIGVGVGRVALNVHHPSDVIAGWALGYVWFVVCLPVLAGRVREADQTPAAPGSAR